MMQICRMSPFDALCQLASSDQHHLRGDCSASQHIYHINISTMPCNAQLSVLLFSVPFLSLSQFRLMSRNFLWKPYICNIWKLMYCLSQFVEAALYFAKYLLCGCDHYKLFICFARPAISVWGVSSLCDTRPRPSQFILRSLIASSLKAVLIQGLVC